MNDVTVEAPASTESEAALRRRKLRLPLMIGGAVLILGGAALWYVLQGRYEATDDAYVNAARIAISSNVAGRVTEILVHDNQVVNRGQVLFKLDEPPFRLAVEAARARLANAIMQVNALKATYRQRQSELRSAQNTLTYERSESARQKNLLASGISSRAQYDRAAHARDAAAQAAAAAQQQLANVLTNLGGDAQIDPSRHPAVQQEQAALDRALLDLSYTTVTAPADGIVTQVEKLQAGDYVNTASPLFALVATQEPWVDANFKEVQLAKMHIGQRATVVLDAYGDKRFEGHVASFSPGTGAQFALLPPQNATGNWVKVVQRLPVRIAIDNPDPTHPLYAGLSARVKVDTREGSTKETPPVARTSARDVTRR